jgi:recombination associated protein RdgC
LKRLRFAGALLDEALEPDVEDEAARFDADFAILVLQLRELIERLEELFAMAGDA